MAGNNSIQFVRGTSSKRASHIETSLAGQPIYETDTNRLYVGDGETSVNDLTAVEASAADIAENVKDQNNGAGIKIWIGTQAEFEDLEADEDTIYYITDIVSVLEVDEALKTLKKELADGSFKVGAAGAADNVKSQINSKNIADIFEINGTTVRKATKLATARNMQVDLASGNSQAFDGSADAEEIGVAGVLPVANGGTGQSNLDNVTVGNAKSATSATDANNVKSTINDKAITAIFERDGTTAKKATTIGKYQHNISFEFLENSYNGRIRFSFITSDENPIEYNGEIINTMEDYIDFPIMATGWASVGTAGFFIPDCIQLNDEAGFFIIAGIYYNFHNSTLTTDDQIELPSSGVKRWIDRVIKL